MRVVSFADILSRLKPDARKARKTCPFDIVELTSKWVVTSFTDQPAHQLGAAQSCSVSVAR